MNMKRRYWVRFLADGSKPMMPTAGFYFEVIRELPDGRVVLVAWVEAFNELWCRNLITSPYLFPEAEFEFCLEVGEDWTPESRHPGLELLVVEVA
ncbi:hypothetical protein [Deinococcus cellulosilyticus]|uniref:Uncharacterized protein n=1 Tax=Deinococcus cellulosilyticus (strain DSM 18568 / NBRC 106333 / KACC 11606 / 5516J-15) TaxID=1223518 RepID=A0A511N2X0_DEIC1|nr:hypothetical protein [Deinococcus cellulosilyticus]GEM47194.1 hypothetical protein DC3_28290 [Deinococcus cellulosilyticus NBRC 106333 = KACC 11606]